jgi:PAS domain S-box-containing protein
MIDDIFLDLRRNIEELSIFLDISEGLYAIQSFKEIGEVVAKNLINYFDSDNLGIKLSVYDENEDLFGIVYWKDHQGQSIPVEIACKLSDIKYFTKVALEQKRTLYIDNNHSEYSLKIDSRQKEMPEQSMIFIPLYFKEKFVGLFSFSRLEKDSIDKPVIEFLENIANYMSASVYYLLNEQRRNESELLLTEERNLLRTIIDNSPDDLYVKDIKSRFTLVNDQICFNKNVRPEEILGKTDFDFATTEVASKFFIDEQKLFKTGKPMINQEYAFFDRKEKRRVVSISKVPLKNSIGEIVGLIGYNRDCTEINNVKIEMEVLMDISNDLYAVKSFQTIGKIVLENVMRLEHFNIQDLKLYIYDEEKDQFYNVINHHHKDHSIDEPSCKLKEIIGFNRVAIEQKNSLIVNHSRSEMALKIDQNQKNLPERSMIFIPLYFAEKLFGILNLTRTPKNSIDKYIADYFENICKSISISIWKILSIKNKTSKNR